MAGFAVATDAYAIAYQRPAVEGAAAAPRPRSDMLAILPEYIAQQAEELVLKEKVISLSGDSFSVKNIQGQPIMQVKGEAFSLSGRKHVMDMNGRPLFDIRKEHFKIHSTYYCEDPNGIRIFQLQSKFART